MTTTTLLRHRHHWRLHTLGGGFLDGQARRFFEYVALVVQADADLDDKQQICEITGRQLQSFPGVKSFGLSPGHHASEEATKISRQLSEDTDPTRVVNDTRFESVIDLVFADHAH